MSSKKETLDRQSKAHTQADLSLSSHQQIPTTRGKSASVIERELRHILPQIGSEQRQAVAQQFLKDLGNKGLEKQTLQKHLSLTTAHAEQMEPEEISKLATYAYQHYPDVFRTVLTQPHIIQFLSNPILSAIVGIMAAKWLNQSPG